MTENKGIITMPTAPVDILSKINSPSDLRKLSVDELPEVCAALRRMLIDELSRNPGHFASSMGAVELTVALHYVFNTPYDRIVWDVGHQAYSHKIITGRRDRFKTNRTYGGLSGFPNPDESEYDTFTAGHASNSISAALGFAIASHLKNETPHRNVVAVVGDASISGGLAFEGINNAANTPNDLLIVLNDNDMSIDRNVGSLNSYLAHINTSKSYNAFRFKTYKALKKIGLVNDRRRGAIMRLNNSLKSIIGNEQNIFEGLNIRYFGPFDGNDIKKVVKVLNDIKDMTGPKILHLRTVKGKGYAPAEQDPAHWHAPGVFNAATGQRKTEQGSAPKYQDVFGDALLNEASADERIVAITAAMPSGTSVSTMQATYPERVFDVGISEGHAVTFAGGLAKEGLRPVVAIYSSFLQRGYDHIIHDVAISRLPVIFAIDRAGIVGEDGVTHHGMFDLAYLRTVPGMVVSAPRDARKLVDLLRTALNYTEGPFAIRYPRGKCDGEPLDKTYTPHVIPVGKGDRISDGKDAVILSIGAITAEAVKAREILRRQGLDVAVYDMVYAKPIDDSILTEVVSKELPVVTVEDGTVCGGLGSAVLEWLAAHGAKLSVKVVGIPDRFVKHGTVAQLRHDCGIDADAIADAVKTIRL